MATADDAGIGEEPEYEEKLDDKPKSILMSMIKQLKTGMDLSKVSASMLRLLRVYASSQDAMLMIHHLHISMVTSSIQVTLPTFILEPRSFLEKCSDFMLHGKIIHRFVLLLAAVRSYVYHEYSWM